MTPVPTPRALARHAAAAVLATGALAGPAHAVELYGNVGLPGLQLGVAQPLDGRFALHGDLSTIGTRSYSTDDDGTHYEGHAKWTRIGLFGDWFPLDGGLRLTGGATYNDLKIDLTASGAGRSVTVNGQTVVLGPLDRIDATVTVPKLQPYIGIGWGHRLSAAGWGFVADVGASFGKPKVRGVASGPAFTAAGITQQDVDVQLQSVRDSVGKITALPQLSVGVGYRF